MKRTLLILSLILSSMILVNGQATQQTDEEKEARNAREAAFNNRVDRLRNVGKDVIIRDRYKQQKIFEDKIQPIYREPTKEERELVKPLNEDFQKYSEFLKQKGTGLVKLIIDRECDKGIDIVVSTPHCVKYSMPGAGSSYSFREETYRMSRFADLSFSNNRFFSNALLVQSIFTDIGSVPLEGVDMNTSGMKFLKEFEPSTDMDEIVNFNIKLEKGIEKDNFTYNLSVPLYENTTYLLRSVACRANVYRAIEDIPYNEFDFDERKDITVAFRVVSYQSGEGVTILWKILDEQKVPKLKLEDK